MRNKLMVISVCLLVVIFTGVSFVLGEQVTDPVLLKLLNQSVECEKAFKFKDYVKAFPICLDSAEQGVADSQNILGYMYNYGHGVKQDNIQALTWYRKAAEQGCKMAQETLGFSYLYGIDGVNPDYAEAANWYRKAAEHGDTDAQSNLDFTYNHIGWLYESGSFGVKQDFAEAAVWYRKAAERGHADSQYNLGDLYASGQGVPQNDAEAVAWFRKAAEQGHAYSQKSLGSMYYEGKGVEQSYFIAAKWYRKAADQGNKFAQEALGSMYYEGKGVPKNYAEAVKLFQKSAYQGYSRGQWNLGATYYDGEGVTRDKVQALAWLTLAATNNADAVEFRDRIEKDLKPHEVIQAQNLAAKLQSDIEKRFQQKHRPGAEQEIPSKQVVKTFFAALTPTTPTKPAFTANDIAVIIGIEKYRTVPPTEYAAADAGTMRDYLKALGFAERNIEFLADERATLSDIRKVIETKLPNMVKPTSRVIVYYAGHGAPAAARGESYIVPYDGDPAFLTDTAYPLSRLYDRLSRLKAKEVLVILDSCFSGAGGRSVLAKGTRPLVMVRETPPPASKKMIVLTSARGSQITTSLPETGHGAFTYFFLRALQEGNRDISEVFAYLNTRVTEEAKRQNVDQTPTIHPTPDKLKGRFVFVR